VLRAGVLSIFAVLHGDLRAVSGFPHDVFTDASGARFLSARWEFTGASD
jgi:hypothetical protein